MLRGHDVLFAAAVVAVLGCGNSSKQSVKADDAGAKFRGTAAEPKRPRLVVLVVIDQLPSWRFESDQKALTGGLRRLIDAGLYVPRAEFPYAATFTAPGHAALCTGAPPSVTGILANGWYDRETQSKVGAVADPASPSFWLAASGPKPTGEPEGISGRRLQVDGVGDVLRTETDGKGKSIAIGLKERASVVALGRKPTLALWYDERQGALTTSSWYAANAPAWLEQLAADKPPSKYFREVWTPGDEKRLAELSGNQDEGPGEGVNYGLNTVFPHSLAESGEAAKAIRATPWGTQIVFDGAVAAIEGEALGQDDTPDLLALTFSSHDYAGHYWGQESWERLDLLLDLDQRLGELLDELDRRIGKDHYAVVVSSDHGATPMVEQSVAAGKKARRVLVADIVAAANRAAVKVLGVGNWVDEFSASTLYMTEAFRGRPAGRQNAALDAIARAVIEVDGIGYAARTDQLAGDCDARDGLDALACRSIQPGQSGDIFVVPDRYCITTTSYTTGTSHGTASDEDRFVPIIVYAPGVKAGVRTEPTSVLQVAPTVSRLLRIKPPAAALAPSLVD